MDTDAFWDLIDRSAAVTSDPDERLEWLADELSRHPVDDIVGFDLRLSEVRATVDNVDGAGLRPPAQDETGKSGA